MRVPWPRPEATAEKKMNRRCRIVAYGAGSRYPGRVKRARRLGARVLARGVAPESRRAQVLNTEY